MKKFYKRADKLKLTSKDLNTIFEGLKYEKTYTEIFEIFEFLVGEEFVNKEIQIPSHNKFRDFIVDYESFKDLYKYFERNTNLIPFNGDDYSLKNYKN